MSFSKSLNIQDIGIDTPCLRQILAYKDGPSTERIKIFKMAVDQ